MKKALTLVALICGGLLFAAGDTLPKVVVEQFVNKSDSDPQLFITLKSRIENEIINTRKFTYLERGENLKNITAERGRIASGLVAEEDLLPGEDGELPTLKAAGYSIYGEILSLGLDQTSTTVAEVNSSRQTAKVEIQLRLSDIETGEVLASKIITASRSASRTAGEGVSTKSNFEAQGMNEAIAAAAKKVVCALMELAYPAKVLAVNVRQNIITVNLTKEQTEVGKLYDLFTPGEELVDPDTGESLGENEECLGRVKVTRTLPKIAHLTPVGDLEISAIQKGMLLREVDEETLLREKKEAKAAAKRKFKSRF